MNGWKGHIFERIDGMWNVDNGKMGIQNVPTAAEECSRVED